MKLETAKQAVALGDKIAACEGLIAQVEGAMQLGVVVIRADFQTLDGTLGGRLEIPKELAISGSVATSLIEQLKERLADFTAQLDAL
jgi:hypothetical protein